MNTIELSNISKNNNIDFDNLYDQYSNNIDYQIIADRYKLLYNVNDKIVYNYVQHNTIYQNIIKIGNENTDKIYYKFVKESMSHHDFIYKDGFNLDKHDFDPSIQCSKGGLYFSDIENLHNFYHFGSRLYRVIIPRDIPICLETHKPDIQLNNKPSCDWFKYKTIDYIKYKSPALYLYDYVNVGSKEFIDMLYNTSPGNNSIIISYIMKYYNEEKYKNMFNNIDIDLNSDIIDFKIKVFGKYNKMLKNYNKDNKENEEDINQLNDYLYKMDKDTTYNNISNICYSYLYYENDTFFRYLKDYYYDFLNNILPKKQPIILNPDKAISNIKEYLTHICKFNTDKFLDLIKKYEGVISGSFLLSKNNIDIDNKNFDDIDIYIKKEKGIRHEIEDIFKNTLSLNDSGLFTTNIFIYERIKTKKSVYFSDNLDYSVLSVKIKNSFCDFKLQFIFVDENPYDFINKSFDFDFCKIIFDGDKILSNHFNEITNYNGNISDEYIKSCLDIKSSMSKYRICKTLERIDKYIRRGYTINNYKYFLDIIIKYINNDE